MAEFAPEFEVLDIQREVEGHAPTLGPSEIRPLDDGRI
jgi:hypothetical protein